MNQEIKRIIKSYASIIDLEETEEVMHLIADLDELMSNKLSREEYALATLGQENPKSYEEYLKEA